MIHTSNPSNPINPGRIIDYHSQIIRTPWRTFRWRYLLDELMGYPLEFV